MARESLERRARDVADWSRAVPDAGDPKLEPVERTPTEKSKSKRELEGTKGIPIPRRGWISTSTEVGLTPFAARASYSSRGVRLAAVAIHVHARQPPHPARRGETRFGLVERGIAARKGFTSSRGFGVARRIGGALIHSNSKIIIYVAFRRGAARLPLQFVSSRRCDAASRALILFTPHLGKI